jgi:hypothetical protein
MQHKEIAEKVKEFRVHLDKMNKVYADLQKDGVYISLDRVEQDNKTVQYDAGIIHQTIKY